MLPKYIKLIVQHSYALFPTVCLPVETVRPGFEKDYIVAKKILPGKYVLPEKFDNINSQVVPYLTSNSWEIVRNEASQLWEELFFVLQQPGINN